MRMDMAFHVTGVAVLIAALAVSGCGRGSAEQGGDDSHAGHDHGEVGGGADDHADHEDDVIRLGSEEATEFGITAVAAGPGQLERVVVLLGEVALNPDRVAHVVARAGGIAREISAIVGDRVDAGDRLAVLESPGLAEAKAHYLSQLAAAELAETDLERAEAIFTNTKTLLELVGRDPGLEELRETIEGLDVGARRGSLIEAYAELRASRALYERESGLLSREATSESEFLEAESRYKKAIASFAAMRDDLAFANRRELDSARRERTVAHGSLQAAERQLHALGMSEDDVSGIDEETDAELSWYSIAAPISGRIIERHIVRGESIGEGGQIFVIADLDVLWVTLTLYQKDLGTVSEGDRVRLRASHGLAEAEGTVDFISPILDQHTRTTTARVVLANAEGTWRPGLFVTGSVFAGAKEAEIVVPRSAVQQVDGESIVFIETFEGFELRHVEIGASSDSLVEVTQGLRTGERVVVSGVLALRAELDRASLEHAGHAH